MKSPQAMSDAPDPDKPLPELLCVECWVNKRNTQYLRIITPAVQWCPPRMNHELVPR